jgi:hypothetical protein
LFKPAGLKETNREGAESEKKMEYSSEPVPKPIGVLEQALGENCQFLISQALTAFAIFSLGKRLFQKLKFWNSLKFLCFSPSFFAVAVKCFVSLLLLISVCLVLTNF